MATVRPVPPCFGQSGRITCICTSLPIAQSIRCISNRYFHSFARALIDAPDNPTRRAIIAPVQAKHGKQYADELRKAVKHQQSDGPVAVSSKQGVLL